MPDLAWVFENPGSFQAGNPSLVSSGGAGFPETQPIGNGTMIPSGVIASSKSHLPTSLPEPKGRWIGEGI